MSMAPVTVMITVDNQASGQLSELARRVARWVSVCPNPARDGDGICAADLDIHDDWLTCWSCGGDLGITFWGDDGE
jgi:hypothetical protein